MKTSILILAVGLIIIGCTPKKNYKDKMIDLAVNDLHQKAKVPSSFIIDSTKIKLVENHIYDKYNGLYQVNVFYQSQNSYGVLLKGEALYYIRRDPQSGKISIYDRYLGKSSK